MSTLTLSAAVAFRIYDLDKTGDIQPGEVVRLLAALLQNNPDIALDDSSIQQIVSQVGGASGTRAQGMPRTVPALSIECSLKGPCCLLPSCPPVGWGLARA